MLGCEDVLPILRAFQTIPDVSSLYIFIWSALQISLWTIKRSSKDPTINDFFFELFLRDAVEDYPTRVAVFFLPGVHGAVVKKRHFGSHALNEHFHDPLWSNVFRRTQDISGNFLLQVLNAWESNGFFLSKTHGTFHQTFGCWPWQATPNFIPRGYIYTSHTYISYTHPGCTWLASKLTSYKALDSKNRGEITRRYPFIFGHLVISVFTTSRGPPCTDGVVFLFLQPKQGRNDLMSS